MDLVDEEDSARREVREQAREIARLLEHGAGGELDPDTEFPGKEEGKRRLPEARRSVEEGVVERLRAAARRLGDWRLTGCTLYTTLEPCAQCAGAIVLARIPRLVFGAHDPKAGMAGSLGNLVQDPRLNHRVDLMGGVLADRSAQLLRGFFRARREKAANLNP